VPLLPPHAYCIFCLNQQRSGPPPLISNFTKYWTSISSLPSGADMGTITLREDTGLLGSLRKLCFISYDESMARKQSTERQWIHMHYTSKPDEPSQSSPLQITMPNTSCTSLKLTSRSTRLCKYPSSICSW
jgi:hypothetical protein